ncbi:putative transcriptional regulator, PucR family [Catenulispora acidiphila DSM 44928]|uniref:Putative transcriptional regulator, PucR family n=1 Tax=Catenulispora acidiphila (strain DSM 44928 / JCM 14897 / NBRC 102108 / NRRL B-24433 / ID139908) TaxID=479433 RepID=C7QFV4_CATAD|nr:helix-turn-helix domain-containing protein [Catenulispora acidiphila]ACU70931.1 putative transcriptional regulator, PucR family [Catenulispora acidiphila DSM 44928]
MADDDQVDAGAEALAARMLERTEEFAAAVTARITALVPVYAERVSPADLRRSVVSHFRVIFDGLLDPALDGNAPADLAGRARAAEGVPMSAVFEAYQISLAYIWEHLAEAAERDEVAPRVALRAASALWRRLSGFTDVMADSYRAELSARIRSEEQRRSALIQALLEGHLSEPQVWEAADALRLPHQGPYVVIAARVAGAGEHGLTRGMEEGLQRQSITSAWRLLHDVEIGLASLPRPADQLDVLIEALAAGSVGRVGISPLYDDLTGTSQALRLARIALRGAASPGKVVVFGRDSLSVAAASAPDVMARLSRAIFAGLDTMPAEDRAILLDTFGAWLDHGGSADEAARKLYVHPNTVRYRLRRLEERTGRTLSDPRHVAELSLAFEVDRGRVALLAEGDGESRSGGR